MTVLSALTGLPALFVRKQAKEYGTCKLAEGPDVAGRRVTLVEDVITTGGAVRDATRALREAGAVVEVVVCAIDRSPAGENPLADVGLEVRPVLTKADARRRLRLVGRGSGVAPLAGVEARDVEVGAAVAVVVVGLGGPTYAGGATTRRRSGSPRRPGSRRSPCRCSRRGWGTPRRGSSRSAGCWRPRARRRPGSRPGSGPRFIRVTPATTVMKVRTNGTKRPMTSALLPCLSKNTSVWSKYFFFRIRPSRS